MDWKELLKIIWTLPGCEHLTLAMRKDFSWYITGYSLEKADGHILSGGCENGRTPEEAVWQFWKWITTYKDGEYMVANAYRKERQAFRMVTAGNFIVCTPVQES